MLRDLTIQNYRCFKDFHIDGLARVNLIVGRNNIGKTSLLEAVYLLINQGNLLCLTNLLHNRGEIGEASISSLSRETHQLSNGYQVKHIFCGHHFPPKQAISLQSKKEDSLTLKIQIEYQEDLRTNAPRLLLTFSDEQNPPKVGIPIRNDGLIEEQYLHSWQLIQNNPFITTSNQSIFLTSSDLSFERLALFWNGITLTPKEENVVKALQILEPNVERFSFTSRQTPNSGILIKIRGQNNPIPLGSMGEGMRRILTLAMATVTAENGFLLVDEIDAGLYYESQTDMWRLILETAQQLDVQVFATTHSWDCIAAFQEALDELEDSSVGKLVRLSRKGENIRPVDYPAEKLAVAVRQNIEVR